MRPISSSVTASLGLLAAIFVVTEDGFADDPTLHVFERIQLTDTYYSEGAAAGDIDGDGHVDVVYGPYWFAGPDFREKHEIYPPVAQDRNRYADHFFAWIYDFNGNGRNDILVAGFPGTPAYVYENPGPQGLDRHWKKHQVFDWVSNESPYFGDLTGDGRPELVCTRDGFFGFATIDWEDPFSPWEFHPISAQVAPPKFGHGLGVGDINGNGRMDVLHSKGWFEQPASDALTSRWISHDVSFSSSYGGAEMLVYDVDGDGLNDVITSEAAHDFGLSWYQQVREEGTISFRRHVIMGDQRGDNPYGVLFSEPHSLALADIDGDGLQDIVTGKTYYSHHQKSPLWDAGAVVYWFRLTRTDDGVHWIPYRMDGEAGIGRQVVVADVNGNSLPDLVLGGMQGGHVLIHRVEAVDQSTWDAAQPKRYVPPEPETVSGIEALRGPKSSIDAASGRVAGAIEGESLVAKVTAGRARTQAMGNFQGDRWSGNGQLFWTGAGPGEELTVELPARQGRAALEVVLTCAPDYGIVQLLLDDEPIGPPIDCYQASVTTTGVLKFPDLKFGAGTHLLTARVVGTNPQAKKAYMFGLDYVRFVAEGETFPAPAADPGDVGFRPKSSDGSVLNLDFETGTLQDWTATGTAFADQPIRGDSVAARRSDMRSGHAGEYWVGTFERGGDGPTGSLTSVAFPVTHPYATFFVGGGKHFETRVELVRAETGKPIYQIAGQSDEQMRRVVVDLRAHLGREIFIRLVDEHRGGWGHINFDHFQFHDTRPGPLTPPLIELVPDEYPYAGLSAEDAVRVMELPDGFQVTVGAAEPDVKQPIAMALDHRGRVWVAEAYEYPIRADGDRGRDRILIFEDTNGDGKLDHRKVFYEGLNLVSGLEVGFGGVWVGAAPYLLFIPDRDGDDVPDGDPQVVLDGWGYQDTHETLNALVWGPDGWLYGCHGVFTHSAVGKPGTPDKERVRINAGVWRYHPTEETFEVFAHGPSNPWGMDFNDYGQAFITACVIPHLYHVVQGARYQRQAGQHFNPHTYRDIVTIADHLHYLGATPHSGNSKSDAVGGGHAHAGAMIYLGATWPQQYRNAIFMNNIHGQRLNVDTLTPHGSGYIGSHAPDFLLTGDQASQILNLRYGPDGNVWMIDWYDMQACHRREVEAHDRTNGRIFKICYGESSTSAPEIDLESASDLELAELTLHANDWYVRHARRGLQERAANRAVDPDARDRLRVIARTAVDETRVLRAMWALHVSGGIPESLAEELLGHADAHVRSWCIQLRLEREPPPPATVSRMERLAAEDPSPVVRLYLAAAAQRMKLDERWNLVTALCSHAEDGDDHNLPLMIWYAAEPLAEVDPESALQLAMVAGQSMPLIREFMLRRIASLEGDSSLDVLVRGLAAADEPSMRQSYLEAVRRALQGRREVAPPRGWDAVFAALRNDASAEVRTEASALGVKFGDRTAMDEMRSRIIRPDAPEEQRRFALETLLEAKDPELPAILLQLVSRPSGLRESAIRGLAQYDDSRSATVLLEAYDGLSSGEKRTVLSALSGRAADAKALLQAIESGNLPAADLPADLVRQIQYHQDGELETLLARVWGTARETDADKLQQIETYKDLVRSSQHESPDPMLGRAVFAKTCQNCHVLYGVGYKVGPDLTGSNRSNLDYLLSNIVDPSAVMAKEYQPTIVLSDDGRIIIGLVHAEDDNVLSLQTADAVVTIPKEEIEERSLGDQSMMPEDQLRQFTPHEIRSLFAYLQGREQVPVLATPDNASQLFNGTDLSGWSGSESLWTVENGEIVGRSAGLKHNEWLISDLAAEDFRLSMEVKLVNNEGNSGVQFRSQAVDGSVSGYQADIGAGWWGKLYEEHGRKLLWDRSGEEHLRSGDWNRYQIEAHGNKIRTFLNGQLCVDLDDPHGASRGIFALQLHSGGPMEVRFRDLKLEIFDSRQANPNTGGTAQVEK